MYILVYVNGTKMYNVAETETNTFRFKLYQYTSIFFSDTLSQGFASPENEGWMDDLLFYVLYISI